MTTEKIKACLTRDGKLAIRAFLNIYPESDIEKQKKIDFAEDVKAEFWEEVRAFATLSNSVNIDFYNNFSEVVRDLWNFHSKTPFSFLWLFDGELGEDFYNEDFNDTYNETLNEIKGKTSSLSS